jgi:serine/threonine protein kinase
LGDEVKISIHTPFPLSFGVWTNIFHSILLSGLNHANVVELVGFCTVPLCIISEYVPEGNLYELIHDKSKPLSLALQLRIAMDIAKALRFLHWRLSPPMIHNDLKSPNVLLVSCKEEADVIAKITDFGLSRQTFQDKRTTDEDGNPRWLAPEVLRGEQYGNKIDIYALGIILWEMTTRDHFLDHKFMYVIRDRILAKERPVIPDETIPQLRDTISKCWCDDPEVRPDVNYCIETLISAIGEHTPHLLAVATAERPVVSTRIVRKPSPNESVTREALQQKEAPFRANRIAALVPESSAKLQPIRKLEAIGEGSIFCLLYAKHYKQIWCGDGRGTIKVLSEDGEVLHTSKCHEKMITTLVWIKPYIWSGSVDGSLKVWHKSMVLIKEIKNMQASSIIKVLEKVWVSTLNMELLVLNKKVHLYCSSTSPHPFSSNVFLLCRHMKLRRRSLFLSPRTM